MERLTGKQIGWFHEIIKDPMIGKKTVWKHFTDFDQNQKQIFIENLIRVYRNSQLRYRECLSGEKYQKMSERLLHYKYLSQPIVQWKKYYKELDHIKRIEGKLTDKNKEIKILKEKYKKLRESDKYFLKSKEKSIQHYLQLIHDLRSQLKKEDKVNGLLKIQNKNLNKKIYELQILHNKNSQTKDDTTITNVVDQPNLFNREKTQKQRTKKSWFSC